MSDSTVSCHHEILRVVALVVSCHHKIPSFSFIFSRPLRSSCLLFHGIIWSFILGYYKKKKKRKTLMLGLCTYDQTKIEIEHSIRYERFHQIAKELVFMYLFSHVKLTCIRLKFKVNRSVFW